MGVRLCLEPGCMNTTQSARCADHERAWQRARNQQPGRQPRRTRAYTNIPLGPQCLCCGATQDLTRHHVEPLAGSRSGGMLITMCRRCNSSIGTKRMAGLACPMHGGTEA